MVHAESHELLDAAPLPSLEQEEALRFFLHLGYFPEFHAPICPVDLATVKAPESDSGNESILAAEGKRRFLDSIASDYRNSADIVVPLSGGLDSRAILAGLLEFREAGRIRTVTYGTRDTLDYDIGNAVARVAGTQHVSMELTERPCDLEELIATAKRFHLQTMLFRHPRLSDFDRAFSGCEVWSGYVGDAVVGGHLHQEPSRSVEEAKFRYCRSRRMGKSVSISGWSDAEAARLIRFSPVPDTTLTLDEQMIFAEGVYKCTAPHIIYSGFHYVTPFINNGFMRFFLGLPLELRKGQVLYRSMLKSGFPQLFSLASTSVNGGVLLESAWRTRTRKLAVRARNLVRRKVPRIPQQSCSMTNYLDFDKVSRRSGVYYDLFAECLQDLAKRDLVSWLDIPSLWIAHQKRLLNAGTELSMLVSLEILIKAGKRL